MPSHAELLQQMQALQQQIDDVREAEYQQAIEKIRHIMEDVEMSDQELVDAFSRRRYPKVLPKYRNDDTGETWTGRGRKPLWLETALAQGKTLEDFAIPAPAPQGKVVDCEFSEVARATA